MVFHASPDVKISNRRAVFEFIKNKPTKIATRPEIAKALKITEPTVLKIIDFFLERDIVTYHGESDTTSVGRKPNMLIFQPNAAYSIGVDYDGATFKLAVVNLDDETVFFKSKPLKVSLQKLLDSVVPYELSGLDVEKSKISSLGIALPAVVDTEKFIVNTRNPAIDCEGREDFASDVNALSQKIQIPVFMENDVNAAAISEYKALRNKRDIVFIMLGIGLGSGIILDGKLRRGKHFSAGEIGYMTLQHNFVTSTERPGWFENILGREYIKYHFGIDIFEDCFDTQNASYLIEHMASHISLIVANLSSALDVDTFIIGGCVAEKLGDRLIERVKEYCSNLCIHPIDFILDVQSDIIARGVGIIGNNSILNHFLSDNYNLDRNQNFKMQNIY